MWRSVVNSQPNSPADPSSARDEFCRTIPCGESSRPATVVNDALCASMFFSDEFRQTLRTVLGFSGEGLSTSAQPPSPHEGLHTDMIDRAAEHARTCSVFLPPAWYAEYEEVQRTHSRNDANDLLVSFLKDLDQEEEIRLRTRISHLKRDSRVGRLRSTDVRLFGVGETAGSAGGDTAAAHVPSRDVLPAEIPLFLYREVLRSLTESDVGSGRSSDADGETGSDASGDDGMTFSDPHFIMHVLPLVCPSNRVRVYVPVRLCETNHLLPEYV